MPKIPAPPTMTGRKNWISETPRLPPAALRPSAAPFLDGGVEEVDVGHRAGEVAAAEAGRRGDQAEHPERRVRPLHGVGEPERRDQQQRGAGHRPVAAAELRHREGVGQPQQRPDQVRQRDEQEQLLRRVVEPGRDQERRADAPDQPDREAEVLGEDRPDQVAPGDRPAGRLPELGVLGAPVVDPAAGTAGRGGRRLSGRDGCAGGGGQGHDGRLLCDRDGPIVGAAGFGAFRSPSRRRASARRTGRGTPGMEVRVMTKAPVRSGWSDRGSRRFRGVQVTVSPRSLCPHGLTGPANPPHRERTCQ